MNKTDKAAVTGEGNAPRKLSHESFHEYYLRLASANDCRKIEDTNYEYDRDYAIGADDEQ